MWICRKCQRSNKDDSGVCRNVHCGTSEAWSRWKDAEDEIARLKAEIARMRERKQLEFLEHGINQEQQA